MDTVETWIVSSVECYGVHIPRNIYYVLTHVQTLLLLMKDLVACVLK